jgi:hypothetical protein
VVPGPFVPRQIPTPPHGALTVIEGPDQKLWMETSSIMGATQYFGSGPTEFQVTPPNGFSITKYDVDPDAWGDGATEWYTPRKTIKIGSLLYSMVYDFLYPTLLVVDTTDGSVAQYNAPHDDSILDGGWDYNLVLGPDGNLYRLSAFTSSSAPNLIGVTPDGSTWTQVSLTGVSIYYGLPWCSCCADESYIYAAVILEETNDYAVLQIDVSGASTILRDIAADLPFDTCRPSTVFKGPDGNLWVAYADWADNGGGWGFLAIDPSTGFLIHNYTGPPPDIEIGASAFFVSGIMIYNDGAENILAFCGWWFDEDVPFDSAATAVFTLDPSTGTYAEYDLWGSAALSCPTDLCQHTNGEVYVSDWLMFSTAPWGKLWTPPGSQGWHVGQIAVQ